LKILKGEALGIYVRTMSTQSSTNLYYDSESDFDSEDEAMMERAFASIAAEHGEDDDLYEDDPALHQEDPPPLYEDVIKDPPPYSALPPY